MPFSDQVNPLERSANLLRSFLAVHSELTEKLKNKLHLTEEELFSEFLSAAKMLDKTPDALIPLIDSVEFSTIIPHMSRNTKMFGVLQTMLNPKLVQNNENVNASNLNEINPNQRNPNEIDSDGANVYKNWNSVNATTDAEKIAYLEAKVAELKLANEKLTNKVISQHLELERLKNPNYIPGSANIPRSDSTFNKR